MDKKQKRKFIYALIFVLSIISIFWRISVVQAQRNGSVISFLSQWQKNGIPVEAKKLKKENIPVYIRLTLKSVTSGSAQAFVTADVKKELKEEQDVLLMNKQEVFGKISVISQDINVDTGMFLIGIKLNAGINLQNDNPVIFVHTQDLNDVIVIPNEIFDIEQGKFYVWKIENNIVKKVEVVLGERNGFGAVVQAGVNEGDLIVVSGQSQLKDGDKVEVLNNKEK